MRKLVNLSNLSNSRNKKGTLVTWLLVLAIFRLTFVLSLISLELLIKWITFNRIQEAAQSAALSYAREMIKLRDNEMGEKQKYSLEFKGSKSEKCTFDKGYGGCTPYDGEPVDSDYQFSEYISASQILLFNIWDQGRKPIKDAFSISNVKQGQCYSEPTNTRFNKFGESAKLRCQAIGNVVSPITHLSWSFLAGTYNSKDKDLCVETHVSARLDPVMAGGLCFLNGSCGLGANFIKIGPVNIIARAVVMKAGFKVDTGEGFSRQKTDRFYDDGAENYSAESVFIETCSNPAECAKQAGECQINRTDGVNVPIRIDGLAAPTSVLASLTPVSSIGANPPIKCVGSNCPSVDPPVINIPKINPPSTISSVVNPPTVEINPPNIACQGSNCPTINPPSINQQVLNPPLNPPSIIITPPINPPIKCVGLNCPTVNPPPTPLPSPSPPTSTPRPSTPPRTPNPSPTPAPCECPPSPYCDFGENQTVEEFNLSTNPSCKCSRFKCTAPTPAPPCPCPPPPNCPDNQRRIGGGNYTIPDRPGTCSSNTCQRFGCEPIPTPSPEPTPTPPPPCPCPPLRDCPYGQAFLGQEKFTEPEQSGVCSSTECTRYKCGDFPSPPPDPKLPLCACPAFQGCSQWTIPTGIEDYTLPARPDCNWRWDVRKCQRAKCGSPPLPPGAGAGGGVCACPDNLNDSFMKDSQCSSGQKVVRKSYTHVCGNLKVECCRTFCGLPYEGDSMVQAGMGCFRGGGGGSTYNPPQIGAWQPSGNSAPPTNQQVNPPPSNPTLPPSSQSCSCPSTTNPVCRSGMQAEGYNFPCGSQMLRCSRNVCKQVPISTPIGGGSCAGQTIGKFQPIVSVVGTTRPQGPYCTSCGCCSARDVRVATNTLGGGMFTVYMDCPDGSSAKWYDNILPSPLILKFGKDPVSQTDESINFSFDGKNDYNVHWIASKAFDIGFLAIDLNQNGIIDNGTELFGNFTKGNDYLNGYKALADIKDLNKDQKISGKELKDLLIWFDLNSDGKSTPEEIKKVIDLKIFEINAGRNLLDKPIQLSDGLMTPHSEIGFIYKDKGIIKFGKSYDMWFYVDANKKISLINQDFIREEFKNIAYLSVDSSYLKKLPNSEM